MRTESADINRMRHRLSLRRAPVAQGNAGAPSATAFAEYLQVWGEIGDLSASQGFNARQATSEITAIARIRFRPGIRPNDRIYWNVNAGPAPSTLSGPGIDASTSAIPVASAAAYPPDAPFLLALDDEIVRVNSVDDNTFTVTRGYAGTVAAAHAGGVGVYMPSLRIFSILGVRDETGLRKFLAIDCKELSNGT